MNRKVCLYGASGHGKVIQDIALSCGVEIECFFDDNLSIEYLQGKKVFGVSEISKFSDFSYLISIGNNNIRKKIAENLAVSYTVLIHNRAVVSPFSLIKEGTVIMANAVVNASVVIGKHCIINTGAVIEHDCKLGNYTHISPNATLCGNVYVGEGAWIGAGATIIPGVKIGSWSSIGAGAVVIKDVPDNAVMAGVPAKLLKYKA